MTHWFEQDGYAVRFDWGADGAARAGARGDTVVIVDTLRFSTAVAAHVSAGACIEPGLWKEKGDTSLLSPLAPLPGTSIYLPSPNGAMCSHAARDAGAAAVFAGALVNASAVAEAARAVGTPITVVACGEKWPDGSLRFALEDLLGAGAIIAALPHLSSSPEAKAARAAFLGAKKQLKARLLACGSGIELIEKGKEADVHYAAERDRLIVAPRLTDGVFSATPLPNDRKPS